MTIEEIRKKLNIEELLYTIHSEIVSGKTYPFNISYMEELER